MNRRELLTWGKNALYKAGNLDYEIDAWLLFSHVLQISRVQYFCDEKMMVSDNECAEFKKLIDRRTKKIPLQHLTGVQEFMGHQFSVNKHVLIPRQDTEQLVLLAVGNLEEKHDANHSLAVLDLCTGSGCVLLSIMDKMIRLSYEITGVGSDISLDALKIAKKNHKKFAHLDGIIKWKCSDLFDCISGKFDIIVSNPPYIPTDAIGHLQEEVCMHDPRIALDGGPDGLGFYREIIKTSPDFLKKDGWLFFEIGCDQADDVGKYMEQAGFDNICTNKDLNGLNRVVSGRYTSV